MPSFRARRHHPLAAASTAVEHLVLRHFGLRLNRREAKDSPPRSRDRAGRPAPP
jgi:hypothetical protein